MEGFMPVYVKCVLKRLSESHPAGSTIDQVSKAVSAMIRGDFLITKDEQKILERLVCDVATTLQEGEDNIYSKVAYIPMWLKTLPS